MLTLAGEFVAIAAEYQEVIQQAQALHNIRITPLQELKGGQTGARLYLVSVSRPGLAQQVEHVVLKLDHINPKARSGEMDLHQQALRLSPPGFAREHIPILPLAPVKAGEAIGIFYAIAGQSLQNYHSLGSFEQGRQMETLFSLANTALLKEWNAGARFEPAVPPQDLLPHWLSYRLKPGGAIEQFFSETLQISPDVPGLAIQGRIFPNPFFYARDRDGWGKARPLDVLTGLQHGDLNTGNILARFAASSRKPAGYYLIDFSLFKEDMPLLYDNAYLNLSYLLQALERLPFPRWVDLVATFAGPELPDPTRAPVEAAGACAVIRAGRVAFEEWVKARHPSLYDDLWTQYHLAAAAAGLNYCNKPLPEAERLAGLIYAAVHLKPVLDHFGAPPPSAIAPLPLPGPSAAAVPSPGFIARPAPKILNNLPAPATPFIGRETEVAAVKDLLLAEDVRLVTLTGPGGTGKTRLAISAAQALLPHFAQGVCFVSLEDVREPDLVLPTIAARFGLREGGGQPLQENLRVFLQEKTLLLVLDNFEQVIAAAPAIAALLSLGSRLKVLVTSRVVLNLRGEREVAVPPMRLPEAGKPVALKEMSQFEAVQLFTQRAQAAQASFEITRENAAAVTELIRRLDGLPLAIELAAARVRILPPQAMLSRLGSRLNLLTGGARDLPARQQTLRQAIDWSYNLLDEPEKALFARLAIFTGGWTLEAAEAVCADSDSQDPSSNLGGGTPPIDVLASLDSLLASSLVRQEGGLDGQPRFRMYETIREYALDKLAERGETALLAQRHALYFARQTGSIGNRIYSREALRVLDWVAAEHDNLRATLAWCLEPGHDIQLALPVIFLTFWFWYRRGYLSEGREWCRRIIARLDPKTPSRAMAFMHAAASMLALWQGDLEDSRQHIRKGLPAAQAVEDEAVLALSFLTEGIGYLHRGKGAEARASLELSLKMFEELGSDFFIANLKIHLANSALALSDIDGARNYLDQALPLAEQVGEQWLVASILNNQGEVARSQRDFQKAQDCYQKSEELFRLCGDIEDHNRLIHSLGYCALDRGDLAQASQLFHESLNVFRELGNRRGIAECLAGIARLFSQRGKAAQAATLLSAAESILRATGADWWPADQVETRHTLWNIQAALPADAFEATWKSGQTMTLEQAIAFEAAQPAA